MKIKKFNEGVNYADSIKATLNTIVNYEGEGTLDKDCIRVVPIGSQIFIKYKESILLSCGNNSDGAQTVLVYLQGILAGIKFK